MSTSIVTGDLSQLEIRIMGYVSRDPVLLDILRRSGDVHDETMKAIFGMSKHDANVPPWMRTAAKIVNFATGYGGGARPLVELIEKKSLENPELELPVPSEREAKRWVTAHKNKYTRYWEWTEWTKTRNRVNGYGETAFGRRRYFQNLQSPIDDLRAKDERASVNVAVQGTAADLVKMAMRNIARDGVMSGWGRMVLQVHDEIVSIVDSRYTGEYRERLERHMELRQPFAPYVDLVVDTAAGENWKDAHK